MPEGMEPLGEGRHIKVSTHEHVLIRLVGPFTRLTKEVNYWKKMWGA